MPHTYGIGVAVNLGQIRAITGVYPHKHVYGVPSANLFKKCLAGPCLKAVTSTTTHLSLIALPDDCGAQSGYISDPAKSVISLQLKKNPATFGVISVSALMRVTSAAEQSSHGHFNCPKPAGQFADPRNCSAYFNCWNEVATLQPCQPGLYFDSSKGYCNWAKDVPCNVTSTRLNKSAPALRTHSGKKTRSSQLEDLVAASGYLGSSFNSSLSPSPCRIPTGQFSDPTNCSCFYNCWHGDWVYMACPDALVFDDVQKYCNWPERVNCNRTSGGSDVSFTILPTSFPSTDQPPVISIQDGRSLSSTVLPVTTSSPYPVFNWFTYPTSVQTNTTQSPLVSVGNTTVSPPYTSPTVTPPTSPSLPPVFPVENVPPSWTYPPFSPTTSTPTNGSSNGTVPPPIYFPRQSSVFNVTTSTVPTTTGTTNISLVSTGTYYPLVNFTETTIGVGNTTNSTAIATNSTLAPSGGITLVAGQPTTASLEPTTQGPLVYNSFNTFSPFKQFNPMPTLFPWSDGSGGSGDGNDVSDPEATNSSAATGVGQERVAKMMNEELETLAGLEALGVLASGNLFNDLQYPSNSNVVPVANGVPGNLVPQTSTVLRDPQSGTVVYVTNNILTQITVANGTLNGTNKVLDHLREHSGGQGGRPAPFRCPKPYGLFSDPKDVTAYFSCWRGSWSRMYCKGATVFDGSKGCKSCWDTPTGCRMIKPDSPAPPAQSAADPKQAHPVQQGADLEREDFSNIAVPAGPQLFSPQIAAPAEIIMPLNDAGIPKQRLPEVNITEIIQEGPRKRTGISRKSSLVKRWASNELDGDDADDYICPKRDGLFQHDTECSAFWNCGDHIGYLQNCPEGLMFDVKAQRCEWYREGECFDGSIVKIHGHRYPTAQPPSSTNPLPSPRPPSPTFFQCPEKHGTFAHPFDCVKFYSCQNWKSSPSSCQNGYLFSRPHGRCELAEQVKCAHATPVPTFRCPQQYGYFADPSSCNKFYQCVDHHSYQLACPGTLIFNSHAKVCDWPAYVSCALNQNGHGHHTTVTTTTTTRPRKPNPRAGPPPAPVAARDFKCPKSYGKFNHPRLDGSYYECIHDVPYRKECPAEHKFVANLRLCIPNSILMPSSPTTIQTTSTTQETTEETPGVIEPKDLGATTTETPENSTVTTTALSITSGTTTVVSQNGKTTTIFTTSAPDTASTMVPSTSESAENSTITTVGVSVKVTSDVTTVVSQNGTTTTVFSTAAPGATSTAVPSTTSAAVDTTVAASSASETRTVSGPTTATLNANTTTSTQTTTTAVTTAVTEGVTTLGSTNATVVPMSTTETTVSSSGNTSTGSPVTVTTTIPDVASSNPPSESNSTMTYNNTGTANPNATASNNVTFVTTTTAVANPPPLSTTTAPTSDPATTPANVASSTACSLNTTGTVYVVTVPSDSPGSTTVSTTVLLGSSTPVTESVATSESPSGNHTGNATQSTVPIISTTPPSTTEGPTVPAVTQDSQTQTSTSPPAILNTTASGILTETTISLAPTDAANSTTVSVTTTVTADPLTTAATTVLPLTATVTIPSTEASNTTTVSTDSTTINPENFTVTETVPTTPNLPQITSSENSVTTVSSTYGITGNSSSPLPTSTNTTSLIVVTSTDLTVTVTPVTASPEIDNTTASNTTLSPTTTTSDFNETTINPVTGMADNTSTAIPVTDTPEIGNTTVPDFTSDSGSTNETNVTMPATTMTSINSTGETTEASLVNDTTTSRSITTSTQQPDFNSTLPVEPTTTVNSTLPSESTPIPSDNSTTGVSTESTRSPTNSSNNTNSTGILVSGSASSDDSDDSFNWTLPVDPIDTTFNSTNNATDSDAGSDPDTLELSNNGTDTDWTDPIGMNSTDFFNVTVWNNSSDVGNSSSLILGDSLLSRFYRTVREVFQT